MSQRMGHEKIKVERRSLLRETLRIGRHVPPPCYASDQQRSRSCQADSKEIPRLVGGEMYAVKYGGVLDDGRCRGMQTDRL